MKAASGVSVVSLSLRRQYLHFGWMRQFYKIGWLYALSVKQLATLPNHPKSTLDHSNASFLFSRISSCSLTARPNLNGHQLGEDLKTLRELCPVNAFWEIGILLDINTTLNLVYLRDRQWAKMPTRFSVENRTTSCWVAGSSQLIKPGVGFSVKGALISISLKAKLLKMGFTSPETSS